MSEIIKIQEYVDALPKSQHLEFFQMIGKGKNPHDVFLYLTEKEVNQKIKNNDIF